VAAGAWVTYALFRHRRQRGQPRRGDASAYEGNLIIPAAGQAHGTPGHSPHRAHAAPVIHHAAHHVGGGGHH
jgi:hypothetical protein